MRCICPKCNSNIELGLNTLPEEGSFNKCPECSAGFLLKRVSFARRVLHRSDEIICAECGSIPGKSVFCQNCHAIYPDFHVAESSSAAKKHFGKIFGFLTKINRISSKDPGRIASTDYGYAAAQKTKGLKLPGSPAKLVAMLVSALVISIAGGYFWYQAKAENEYVENYVRTLFVIKSAADLDLKTCARISTGWKISMLPDPPQPSATELNYMDRANKDVDTLLKRLEETPDKFKASREDISRLSAAYKKLFSFAIKPSGTIDSFSNTTKLLEDEFRKNADALKSRLPEKISAKLNESRKKYKELEDF